MALNILKIGDRVLNSNSCKNIFLRICIKDFPYYTLTKPLEKDNLLSMSEIEFFEYLNQAQTMRFSIDGFYFETASYEFFIPFKENEINLKEN